LLTYANVGIVDTERDTLLGVLPVRITGKFYDQVAVDERDGKVYITDCDNEVETPDTMWVVDCATDSVLKKFECVRRGHTNMCIRWVPWSNRIYLVNTFPVIPYASSLVVIDCNTDSVIVPGMLMSYDYIRDIQLDPVRERIFVVGADSHNVYVLRDVEGGVVEEPSSVSSASGSGLRVQPTPDGYEVSYSIASTCQVDLTVYDLMGCKVRSLVNGQLPAGEHCVNWDCRDTNGTLAPRGVYFIRLDTPDFTDVKKAVVTR
jgi:DNA-binding beta-propeller fold protein YncE